MRSPRTAWPPVVCWAPPWRSSNRRPASRPAAPPAADGLSELVVDQALEQAPERSFVGRTELAEDAIVVQEIREVETLLSGVATCRRPGESDGDVNSRLL